MLSVGNNHPTPLWVGLRDPYPLYIINTVLLEVPIWIELYSSICKVHIKEKYLGASIRTLNGLEYILGSQSTE